MARAPVVAVDFLGLETSIRDRENEMKAEKERERSVKTTGSLLALPDSVRGSAGHDEHDASLPRLGLGTDSSHMSSRLTFSLAQATPWTSKVGKGEETERSVVADEKRVEELSDAEIMQLSGEDCRRYMLKIIKEREMVRPTSNAIETPGPPTSRSHLRMESRKEEEKLGSKGGGSYSKSALPDASSLSAPPGSAFQHDVGGPASSSGARNVSSAPWHTVQSQAPLSEEVGGGASPSERAVNPSAVTPTNQEQPAQAGGFGSPLPNYLKLLKITEPSQRPLQANQSGQGSGAPLGMSRSTGQSHLPGRPPTAQLTIFYSGVVNVYDGVPADKAQAIMLLAGSGSSWSTSTMNPPLSAPVLPSTGGMASSSNSPARSGPAPAVAVVSQAAPVSPPLVATISAAAGTKQGAGRPTLHAELPQARKASLARFLEKRKDRVRGKAPYVSPVMSLKKDVGSSTPPREKSPSPMTYNTSTRSPSPASAGPRINVVPRNRSMSPAQRPGASHLNSNETSSLNTQLIAPPQGAQPSSSEDQTSTSATQKPSPEDLMDWRRQHPHLSSQEQKQEVLESDK